MPKDNELPKPPKAKRNLPTPASPRIRMGDSKGVFVYPPDAKHVGVPDEILAEYAADSPEKIQKRYDDFATESRKSRSMAPSDDELYRQQNYDPALKRNQNGPVMRAPTTKERVGDMIRGAYESVSEQPLARIADMLGLSDIAGIKKSFTTPDDGVRRGEMVGGPSNLAKMGSRGFMNNLGNPKYGTMTNMVEEIKAGPAYQSMKDRGNRYIDPKLTSESPQTIAKAHPALPAEFNMNEDKLMKSLADSENRYVNKSAAADDKLMRGLADSENRFQANRRAPIDMNKLPPGKMEYLDPDVAEYMNPKPMRDFTDPATQRRLRFLTGK